jgi:preprotein translocase subunit SecB
MKASPLLLEQSVVGEISLKPSEKEASNPSEVKVDTDVQYARHGDDPSKWFVRLKVMFGAADGKAIPYQGHIEINGFFQVADSTIVEEKQRQLVAVNCPSILYASAREVIAFLTSRGPHGTFFLPSVSFADQRITPPENKSTDTPETEEKPVAKV